MLGSSSDATGTEHSTSGPASELSEKSVATPSFVERIDNAQEIARRVRFTLSLVTVMWLIGSLQFVSERRLPSALAAAATALISLGLRSLAGNDVRAARLPPWAAGLCTLMILCLSLLGGQGQAGGTFFLVLVPLIAGVTGRPSTTRNWTLVVLLSNSLLHLSGWLLPLATDFRPSAFQFWVQQSAIFGLTGFFVARTRQLYERHLQRGEQREAELKTLSAHLQARTTELELARDKAFDATRAKSAFLANMSHELRTPLNAVIGMASLLAEEQLTSSQREQVNTIRTSSDALLVLISDILDLSKIEAGKLELANAPFQLSRCVEDAVELLATQAQEKGVELCCHMDASVPVAIESDFGRLRQVLINLLANAVKFTAKGEVSLHVSATSGHGQLHEVAFEVRDTGIGIPAERLPRLFQSFEQGDTSMTRAFGGSGLGLAISKALVEKMGGTIRVESTPGQGSTFRFTIVAPYCDLIEPRSVAFSNVRVMNRSVLLVVDNATNRNNLADLMVRWGAKPLLAANPTEAVQHLSKGNVELCILDAKLGSFDGLEFAARLHAQAVHSQLPFILLSPIGYREQLEKDPQALDRLRKHVVGMVTKPVRPAKLSELVRQSFAGPRQGSVHDLRIPTLRSEKLRVLVAEDNPINQRVASRMLEKLGHQAVFVENGLEALAKLEAQTFDVVLLDVQMPVLDGLETARRIVARYPRSSRPRLIAMTASALSGDRERCLAAGMDAYLSKPVDLPSLAAQLRGVQGSDNPRRSFSGTLDVQFIANLKLLSEQASSSVMRDTFEAFLAVVPSRRERLRQALTAGDLPNLVHHAEALQRAASSAGALELATTAGELIQSAKAADLSDSHAIFGRLERASSNAERALRDVLERHQSSKH